MFAAAFDRAEVVGLLLAREADANTGIVVADLKAMALPEPPTAGQTSRASVEGEPQAGRGDAAKGPPKPDVAGITRPFRYNELIGAQGGLTALHLPLVRARSRRRGRSSRRARTSTP